MIWEEKTPSLSSLPVAMPPHILSSFFPSCTVFSWSSRSLCSVISTSLQLVRDCCLELGVVNQLPRSQGFGICLLNLYSISHLHRDTRFCRQSKWVSLDIVSGDSEQGWRNREGREEEKWFTLDCMIFPLWLKLQKQIADHWRFKRKIRAFIICIV